MDNALPLPSGIVDGQQEVLHTNMYVPFFFFFLFTILYTVAVGPPFPAALPFQRGALRPTSDASCPAPSRRPAPTSCPSDAARSVPLPTPAIHRLPAALPAPAPGLTRREGGPPVALPFPAVLPAPTS